MAAVQTAVVLEHASVNVDLNGFARSTRFVSQTTMSTDRTVVMEDDVAAGDC